MNKEELQYTVIQTTNKHSRAVFTAEGIEIRLAKRLTTAQKEQHIQELVEKMSTMEPRQSKRTLIAPFKNITTNNEYCLQLHGQDTLSIKTIRSNTFRFKRNKTYTWQLQLPKDHDTNTLEKRLWKEISNDARNFLTEELTLINEHTYKVLVKNVTVKYAKSMWGNCKSTGDIMLNSALLFVPPHLCTYVIIHELAHRIEANHSSKFWQQVEKYCPTYKEDRKELHTYRLR